MLSFLAIYSPFVNSPAILLLMGGLLAYATYVVAIRFTRRYAWAYLLLTIGLASDAIGTYIAVNAQDAAGFAFGIDVAAWFSMPAFALLLYLGFSFRRDRMPPWQMGVSWIAAAVAVAGLLLFGASHSYFYSMNAAAPPPYEFAWTFYGHLYYGYLLQPAFAIAALAFAWRVRSGDAEEARFASFAFASLVAWETLTLSSRLLRYGTGARSVQSFSDPFIAWQVAFEYLFAASALLAWWWIASSGRAQERRVATLGVFGAFAYGLLVPGGAAAFGAPVWIVSPLLWTPMAGAWLVLGRTLTAADYGASLAGTLPHRPRFVLREIGG